jgi:Ca-activated chloride channel family protein
MLTFAHSWLFLLLPLPLLVRWLLPPFHTARPAVRLPFFAQVAEVTGRQPEAGAAIQRRSAIQGIGYVVIWCALIAALARPQWLEPPIVRAVPTRDLLLAVDLSGSMAAEDFTGKDGQKIDRLSAAKEVLDEFLTRRKGDRVGLIVFGNAAFVQVPFTEDLDVSRQLLAETVPRMAGPKTAFGDAIGLGIILFERSASRIRTGRRWPITAPVISNRRQAFIRVWIRHRRRSTMATRWSCWASMSRLWPATTVPYNCVPVGRQRRSTVRSRGSGQRG